MKSVFPFLVALLFFGACSSNKDVPIGPVESFTFNVKGATEKTLPDSLNVMIGKAFLERYALIDTSMIATGNVIAANILAYDADSKQSKCISGYAILVTEEPKPDPTFEGDYHGSPSKVYFFTGNNYQYEVWNNPVVTIGAQEDAGEEANIDLQHVVSGQCSLFGLRISNPVQVAGVMVDANITFYYWSEEEHKLMYSGRFQTGYSRMGAERESRSGSIKVDRPGAEGSAPPDLLYTMSGDSSFTDRYSWRDGKYVRQERTAFSAVVRNLTDDPYKKFSFDGKDTAALHLSFVEAYENVDTLMEVASHSMRAINLFVPGDMGGCRPGYLITIVERENTDASYPGAHGGTYFIPAGLSHYEEGDYDYVETGSKIDRYNRTDITPDLFYAINDVCPLLRVETSLTGGAVQNTEQELFVWSAGGLKSVGRFTMHHLSLVQAETRIADGRLERSRGGPAGRLNHIFTKDGTAVSEVHQWEPGKFSFVAN